MSFWKRFWAALGGTESPAPPKQIESPPEPIDEVHQALLDSIPRDLTDGQLYMRATYTPVDVAIDRLGRVGLTTKEIINLFHMESEAAGDPHAILGIMDPQEEEGLLRAYEKGL